MKALKKNKKKVKAVKAWAVIIDGKIDHTELFRDKAIAEQYARLNYDPPYVIKVEIKPL